MAPTRRIVGDERECYSGERRTAAARRKNNIRPVAGIFKLLLRFLANDRLMQGNVIEHRAQRVIGIGARCGFFNRLGNCDAERALIVRVPGKQIATGLRHVRRTGDHLGTPCLHHRAAERFLLIADLDHVNADVNAKHLPGKRHRRPPLSGAGLGSNALDARLLVVIGLRHSGVRLVRAGWRNTFVLVIDLRRRTEHFFEPLGADQRRGAPQTINFTHPFGNRNPALGGHFLLKNRHRKNRRQLLGRHRIAVRPERRRRRIGHIGNDVIPVRGNLGLIEHETKRFHEVP